MFNRNTNTFPSPIFRSSPRHHDIDHLFNRVVRHYDFYFHLRQNPPCLASPVNFGVPFLPAKTFDLCDSHTFDTELCERFFDLFDLNSLIMAPNFSCRSNLGIARSFQSKATRGARSHSNCTAWMSSSVPISQKLEAGKIDADLAALGSVDADATVEATGMCY